MGAAPWRPQCMPVQLPVPAVSLLDREHASYISLFTDVVNTNDVSDGGHHPRALRVHDLSSL